MRGARRFFSGAMALLLALALAGAPLPVAAVDEDEARERMAELNDDLERLNKEAKAIQAQLNQAAAQKQQTAAAMDQLSGQIGNTVEQIEVLDERVALLEQRIAQKEREMADKQAEIEEDLDLFKRRMRAMYISGGASNNISIILGAESYSEFLMRAETVSSVAEHDRALLAKLSAEQEELRRIKEGIEADKAGVESDKSAMEEKKSELGDQYQQANAQWLDIAAVEQQYRNASEAKKAEMKKIQAELDAIFAEINRNSNAPYVGGEMMWPTPSLSMITSEFGNRGDFHTGMDISGGGAYGATIVAANSGTVKVANTSFTQGYGYGKYVIIDHGGGMQTLYGHCSKLVVSVGQYVSRGEKIAEVGSTGWSTGPHVHFEVRKNGKAVEPSAYLRG